MSFIGSSLLARLLTQTATIQRVLATGTNPNATVNVELNLRCSAPQEASDIEAERADMASVYNLRRVFTAVPEATIQVRDRFVHAGIDYRIRTIIEWPHGTPVYYELIIEDDS